METPERRSDAEVINDGVASSTEFGTAIDFEIARRIAAQLHGGQASALYSLSSAGHLDFERLSAELAQNRREFADNPEVTGWLDALDTYLASRQSDEPRVYAAALGAYNAGYLHGDWIRATDEGVLWDGIHAVLATSPVEGDEEFAFHDHDNFEGYRLGEYETVANTVKIARFIKEHGRAAAIWLGHEGAQDDWDSVGERFEEAFAGEFDSESDLEQYIYDEMGYGDMVEEWRKTLPDSIAHYVDFNAEQFVHDLQCGGELYTVSDGGTLYAFWSR